MTSARRRTYSLTYSLYSSIKQVDSRASIKDTPFAVLRLRRTTTTMKIYAAHTVPINPPSATPKLTRAQVWEGLKHKSRDPIRYVPAITKCEVIEERADGITRVVEFKPGTGPPGRVTETVAFLGDCRVSKYHTCICM